MTGPSTFPSPMLTSERPAFNLPTDIAGLRAECQQRNLPVTGNKAELRDRVAADELIKSRSFSTALDAVRRPSVPTSSKDASRPTRHFNTSRALKAVKDSSTVDFAYLPRIDAESASSTDADEAHVRLPLAPDASGRSPRAALADEDAAVHRAEISTSSADIPHHVASMAEVHDNSAAAIDYHSLADVMSGAASKLRGAAAEEGTVRQVWNGFLDDLLGPRSGPKTA
ncbi:MAG: hypothetical protein M1821_005910 [Bathelium mastoideum]|nr:MAG: hypothetical protein M1821_005910 [Bathelium mastoideum]KAI9688552.1 MAG: hypothetical protein M1822_001501 [Bathelium mastoideum]